MLQLTLGTDLESSEVVAVCSVAAFVVLVQEEVVVRELVPWQRFEADLSALVEIWEVNLAFLMFPLLPLPVMQRWMQLMDLFLPPPFEHVLPVTFGELPF